MFSSRTLLDLRQLVGTQCQCKLRPGISSHIYATPAQQRQAHRSRRGGSVLAMSRRSLLQREPTDVRQEQQQARYDTLPVVHRLEWRSPLQIVRYPDPRLRAVNARIGTFDERLLQLAAEMFELMYSDEGVGLAAPQVGVNVRLMVYNPAWEGPGEKPRKADELILVNPRIISRGKGLESMEEGCLSFQDMQQKFFVRGDVLRPERVKIKAQDQTGAKTSLTLEGWQARLFQHEYDHLDGILFPDRMSAEGLSQARGKLQQMEMAWEESHGSEGYEPILTPAHS